jgi:hypothetical protein
MRKSIKGIARETAAHGQIGGGDKLFACLFFSKEEN